MSEWKKREVISPTTSKDYSEIWDGHGWQINKSSRESDADKPYFLLDTVQPLEVPASCVCGSYPTLEAAQAEAAKRGYPDWSEWFDYVAKTESEEEK